jgi:hypothetical protein
LKLTTQQPEVNYEIQEQLDIDLYEIDQKQQAMIELEITSTMTEIFEKYYIMMQALMIQIYKI